jgi:outer membrane protein assembly factor BamE (lipoprotein component of BamABCDE complex)
MIRTTYTQSKAKVILSGISLLALTGLGLSGCIIIPTPSHDGVGVITKETIESFEPGKTTRADILLRLGDPAERLEEDRFFVYQWKRIHGYFFAGGGYSGVAAVLLATHSLGIEFTPDNRLKRVKVIHPWLALTEKRSSLEEWMAEEREVPHP